MAGDVVHGRDMEGFSKYGRNFPDEGFDVKFDRRGILGMLNENKPDTNASQFFITLDAVCHRTKEAGSLHIYFLAS